MIPLPAVELTAVKAPINDREALRAQIETTFSAQFAAAGFKRGASLLIKPSALLLNHARRDGHLGTLRVLIESLQRRGGIVSIGDSPDAMLASTRDYWLESGLAHLAEQTGCELFNFEAAKSKAVTVESRVYYLPESLHEFDLIINAGCLGLGHNGELSGAIQNCLGFLPGRQLDAWDKAVAAVDLYAVVAPQLHLIEFELQGERYLVLGEDGVAIDTAIFSLIERARRPKCLTLATEAGLGIGYNEMIEIGGVALPGGIESNLSSFFPIRNSPSLLERIRPINVLRNERIMAGEQCDGCAHCCDVCPTGSIGMSENKFPIWNRSLCIECWRCREHCPSNAIVVAISHSMF